MLVGEFFACHFCLLLSLYGDSIIAREFVCYIVIG